MDPTALNINWQNCLASRSGSRLDLYKGSLQVIEGTAQAKLLRELQQDYPDLVWKEVDDIASEELIEQVATGVRGLMMLTLATAHQMKVTNRLDPEQSIRDRLAQ